MTDISDVSLTHVFATFKDPVTLLRMRETYEKHKNPLKCQRMSSVHLAYLQRIQRVPRVCFFVCHRMRPCLKRIQPKPNVPLAYVSVYRRISDIFHTLAYASTIRNSVTGP